MKQKYLKMAMLPSVFNSNEHEKMADFEPIPENLYMLEIVKSELKENSKKTGKILKLQMKVIDENGKYAGRLIFVDLNMVNPNIECVQIAQRELASICAACGLEMIEDSVELHNIPFIAKVGIKAADAGWPAKNSIRKYINIDEMPDGYNPELKD